MISLFDTDGADVYLDDHCVMSSRVIKKRAMFELHLGEYLILVGSQKN